MADQDIQVDAIELATELTIAWLANSNTRTSAEEVPAFLAQMHSSIQLLMGASAESTTDGVEPTEYTPAVSVRKSLANPDCIISMIDGKPYKTLRRHLSTHGMTPEQYRQRYDLKADYPIVAVTYSDARRAMAHKIGLGNSRKNAAKPATPTGTKRKVETAPE